MSSLVHNRTPIFSTLRNSSAESIAKAEENEGASFVLTLNLEALTTEQRQELYLILYRIKNFSGERRDILTSGLLTLHPSNPTTREDQQQQQADVATVLMVLRGLVTSIQRFTDEFLEAIGKSESETLIGISRHLQELEKDLEQAKVDTRFYSAIFSAFVMALAALLSPVATLAVPPFLERFDLVWRDFMEKPIVDKLKAFQASLRIIHTAISLAGKIQDAIASLALAQVLGHGHILQDAIEHPKEQVQMTARVIRCTPRAFAKANDLKMKGQVEKEGFWLASSSKVGDGTGAAAAAAAAAGNWEVYKVFKFMIDDEEEGAFYLVPCMVGFGDLITKPLSLKVDKVKDGMFKLLPGEEEEGDFYLIRCVLDVTERLSEMDKAVAAAIAQVKMVEHELSQLIQLVTLPIDGADEAASTSGRGD